MAPERDNGAGERPWLALTGMGLVAAVACVWGLRVFVWADLYPGFGDVSRYYYPVYEFFYSNLANGRLLLWNPYLLSGVPTVATLQGGFFYPPHVLYLVFPTAFAMGALGLLHLSWIAISTLWFVRALGVSTPAACVAALYCAFAPAYHDMLLAPNQLETAAWLPAGALAALKLARQPSRRGWAVLSGIAAVSTLAGYPQFAIYNFYVWGAVFVIEVARTASAPRQWLLAGVGFASALGFAGLLSAIQLAPTLELAQIGLRGLETLDASQLLPGGKPRPDWTPLLGPVALALACVSPLCRKHRLMALGLLGLAIASWLVSFGWSPVFDLYLSLPFVGSFRYPSRIAFVTSFCIAVLAGIGLETVTAHARAGLAGLGGRGGEGVASRALLPAAALCFALSTWVIAAGLSIALGVVGVATAGLLVLHWKVRGPGPMAIAVGMAVAAAATAGSLVLPIHLWKLPYAEPSQTRVYRAPPAALADLAGAESRVWAVGLSAGKPPMVPKNAPSLLGVRSIDGYEPFGLRWQRTYWAHLTNPRAKTVAPLGFMGLRATARALNLSRAAQRSRLLDLAAMRWLIAAAPVDARLRSFLAASGMRRAGPNARGGRPLVVFENTTALPRAFATYRAARAPSDDELLKHLAHPDFDPLEVSYVEAGPALDQASGSARGHKLDIVRDDPSVVEIQAELAAPALVVLADTYHPGWKARIDAEPAEVYRANLTFRAVYAPAGSHSIRFEFEHPRFWQGGAISLAALIGWVALLAGRSPKPSRVSA